MNQYDLVFAKTQEEDNRRAVVLFSGGQDSTTVLHYAIARHGEGNVSALGVHYGQKHRVELDCARKIAAGLDLTYHVLDVPTLAQVGESALTTAADMDPSTPHAQMKDVPASFVPARNALFLTVAHAYAANVADAQIVYGGMCQTDYSGYPDCRSDFVRQMQYALNIGYETDIDFITPLMWLTKAETFRLAWDIGIAAWNDVVQASHTCYNGDRSKWNEPWGYGCGECPACELRAKGYAEFAASGHMT